MTTTIDNTLHPLGTHRVLEPTGAMPITRPSAPTARLA